LTNLGDKYNLYFSLYTRKHAELPTPHQLIDLDQARSSERGGSDVGSGSKTGVGVDYGGDGEALCKPVVEWQRGGEGGHVPVDLDIGNRNHDRRVLTGNVRQEVDARGGVGAGCCEGDGLVVIAGHVSNDRERIEHRYTDRLEYLIAGSWYDEVLSNRVEGELAGRRGEEWSGGGDPSLDHPVPSGLFGLLADDGCHQGNKSSAVVVSVCELSRHALQSTQYDFSEEVRQSDSRSEIGRREHVVARWYGGRIGAGKDSIGSGRVQLFLLFWLSVWYRYGRNR
jgi:hypothetical protein